MVFLMMLKSVERTLIAINLLIQAPPTFLLFTGAKTTELVEFMRLARATMLKQHNLHNSTTFKVIQQDG